MQSATGGGGRVRGRSSSSSNPRGRHRTLMNAALGSSALSYSSPRREHRGFACSTLSPFFFVLQDLPLSLSPMKSLVFVFPPFVPSLDSHASARASPHAPVSRARAAALTTRCLSLVSAAAGASRKLEMHKGLRFDLLLDSISLFLINLRRHLFTSRRPLDKKNSNNLASVPLFPGERFSPRPLPR